MNTRRPVFQDRRVREAIAWAYDFEWANKNLFYGAYKRTLSYFANSDLASSGLPQGGELALLDPFRKDLPADVFDKPFTLPVTDGSGNNRDELHHSLDLLKQAGWTVKDRKLVDASGNQMSFAILLSDPTFERVALPYVQTLAHLGIDARVRTVDPSQYQHLMDSFDYDMTLWSFPGLDMPGAEQRGYWSCAAAKEEGSDNEMGVCNPAVDALVAKLVDANTMPQLVDAAHALDRVLLWELVRRPAIPFGRVQGGVLEPLRSSVAAALRPRLRQLVDRPGEIRRRRCLAAQRRVASARLTPPDPFATLRRREWGKCRAHRHADLHRASRNHAGASRALREARFRAPEAPSRRALRLSHLRDRRPQQLRAYVALRGCRRPRAPARRDDGGP